MALDPEIAELVGNYQQMDPRMVATATRPFEVFKALRETEPVKFLPDASLYVPDYHPRGWVITRYEDIREVFRDDEHFSSNGFALAPGALDDRADVCPVAQIDPAQMARMDQLPMYLDPPEFFAYRRLLNPLHSPGMAIRLEADCRQIVNALIDRFIESGEVDFSQDVTRPLPGKLTMRILGLPEDEWHLFANPVHHQSSVGQPAPRTYAGGNPPVVAGMIRMVEVAQERRENPRADMITALTKLEIDGRPLTNYELGGILSILLSGGVDTTTAALGSALTYLGRNPDVRQKLVEDPSLIVGFLEEVLRMWPPLVSFFRVAKKDVVLGGQQIKAGDFMNLVLASANRDPAEFPDPDTFIYNRYPNRHITFTVGIHRCLGSNIARMELRVAVEEILRRIPNFTLREDAIELGSHFQLMYGYEHIGANFPAGAREAS